MIVAAYLPKLELPTSGVLDAPLVCIRTNAAWRAVLLSAVERLSTPYAWQPGTDIERAEQEAFTLFLEIVRGKTMIGVILPYVSLTPPDGCLPCDGASYSRAAYPELYALLDPAFIIDADTFVVPDLRGRLPMGAGDLDDDPTDPTDLAVGEFRGRHFVALTEDELPAHTHTAEPHAHTSPPHSHSFWQYIINIDVEAPGVPDPLGAGNPQLPANTDGAAVTINPADVTINPAGGGAAFNTVPRVLGVRYCIVAV
jgi:microcystin-dependent protein